jgi:hypothetical protein
MRHTRQRVHQQQYVFSLIAKVFGDGTSEMRCTQANDRRAISWRGDHDSALATFFAERFGDEIKHFASALADHTNDDDIGGSEACHHAEQHALANAAARNQAYSLTLANGEKRIDGAYADIEYSVDRRALERILALRP